MTGLPLTEQRRSELLNAAVMSAQVGDDQALIGLVWMASAEHKVH